MSRPQYNADGRQPVGGPLGKLVRGVASGIGLASESYHHHKEKKALKNASGNTASGDENQNHEEATGSSSHEELENYAHLSQQMDEAVWELDEVQDQVTNHGPESPGTTAEEIPRLADSFLSTHPPPSYDETGAGPGQLALPVVITQRRPGTRARGFARAYSPLLEDVDIDQTTFLDFLDNLKKSIQPSPWIQAINLASFAVQGVPEPVSMAVGVAIQMAANAASELHSRSKTNKFLDKVNESFFAPRGLVALVMTWKPSQADDMITMAEFDMQYSISKASSNNNQNGSRQKMQHRFQSSSGATSFEWPETAPLVFPILDELAEADDGSEAKKESAVKRSGKFVQQYMDKRARAEWSGQNPDSTMANATGKEQFYSRYADPNHPASSGDPIALLTGGYLQRGFGRTAVRGRMGGGLMGGLREGLGRGRGGLRGRLGDGMGGRGGRRVIGRGGIGPGRLITGVRKLLQDDVLYLMIVQRPTEEQMAAAMEHLQSSRQPRYEISH